MTTNAMTADFRELSADDVDAVSGGGLHIHGTIGPFHFGLDITAGGIAGHYSINGAETHSGVIWF